MLLAPGVISCFSLMCDQAIDVPDQASKWPMNEKDLVIKMVTRCLEDTDEREIIKLRELSFTLPLSNENVLNRSVM